MTDTLNRAHNEMVRQSVAVALPVSREPQLPGLNECELPIYTSRCRPSSISRNDVTEEFYSDKARIVFCSSSRRMMQKAQVFSLESNNSVRNRLTHSLEVADIGRTLARKVGRKLEQRGMATSVQTECMQTIVESACLIHDIGNPPFGHFGEEAIKGWFKTKGAEYFKKIHANELFLIEPTGEELYDFTKFDGNPQGFRIATRLHCEVDRFGLNLTDSTLLASVKYPNATRISANALFPKKLGIFSSEEAIYKEICARVGLKAGRRYFLAYLMELADDICYCLSDIADSFEKRITTSREFLEDFKEICREDKVEMGSFLPKKIENFSYQVSIKVAQILIAEASEHFANNIHLYIDGDAPELSENISSGKYLKCFKTYARRYIYTNSEAQRIEIAGSRIVDGLLDHYGRLLKISRKDFEHFVFKDEMARNAGLDTEWRIYKQLSARMIKVYKSAVSPALNDHQEWICRARLIVDYISGLTDHSALDFYQNFMGISL